jgi:hypothetical protein
MNRTFFVTLIVIIVLCPMIGSITTRTTESFDVTGDIDVVVARYKEDTEWLRTILNMNSVSRVFLYNKGPMNIPIDILRHPKTRYTELVNKGREADTYLQHIIKHYDDFGDKVVFAQGDPFDQAPEFMEFMKMHSSWDRVYQPISSVWFLEKNVPPREYLVSHGKKFGKATVLEIDYYLDTLENVDFVDHGINSIVNQYLQHRCYDGSIERGIIHDAVATYKIPIKVKSENIGTYHYGAVFAVPRASIVKHDINVYKRLSKYVDSCYMAGYAMERLWSMIFRANPSS